MKKKRLVLLATFVFAFAFAFCLTGCGGESKPADVLENDNMTVQSVYIDDSYAGSEADKDIKRMYVFAEVTANSGTIDVCAAAFHLEASFDDATDTLYAAKVIQDDADGGSSISRLATSYSCSNTLEEILPGTSAKIAIPFNVPAYYLQEGATFTLTDKDNLSEGITFSYGVIQNAESLEAIAEAVDAEGYAAYKEAREDASPEVAKDVMNRLTGYEYFVSTGGLTQTYLFDGDKFVVKAAGLENPGTYVVKNGYLACTQDSTGWVTWIPWKADDSAQNGIDLEISDSYVEK